MSLKATTLTNNTNTPPSPDCDGFQKLPHDSRRLNKGPRTKPKSK